MDPPVHECPPTLFGEKQQFHTYQLHSWSSLAVNYHNNCPNHRLGTDEWQPLARMTHSGKSSNQYHFFSKKETSCCSWGASRPAEKECSGMVVISLALFHRVKICRLLIHGDLEVWNERPGACLQSMLLLFSHPFWKTFSPYPHHCFHFEIG
jgi:hypothetical protein